MLFYRTDILEELKVAPPRTWEEFYAAIPAIQRANICLLSTSRCV